MKKILILIIFTLTLCSCKEKLPLNIQEAVKLVNTNVDKLESFENKFITISDSELIAKITNETKVDDPKYQNDKSFLEKIGMNRLIIEEELLTNSYLKSKAKLEELLKYNAKFSNYDEVKNVKKITFDWKYSIENRYMMFQKKINFDKK